MKYRKIVLLFAALLPVALQAAEVSQERAAATARQLMAGRIEGFDTEVQAVRTVWYEGQQAYHVVQFARGGWALISADDLSQPLIGYNGEGVFQVEGQPESVSSMMDWYSAQVVSNARQGGQRHAGWDEASRPVMARSKAGNSDVVQPLIKVNWNQTGSYQKYCPKNSDGQAVVGCVAVGMAQAMSVAKWPDRPVGNYGYTSVTYGSLYIDYDAEPDYDWNAILAGSNGRDNVARLLWHCGVSVNMNYGKDGSGTQDSYIASALQRNFKYPKSVKYYARSSYGDNWSQLIINELKAGRAVAYSGADPVKSYGHCFNLDGYDGSFFHVNWGWGGNNNGYFGLDGLKDATMDMNYTTGQSVIVGVRAPSELPSDIILSNTSVQAFQPAGTEVGTVTVESEAENPTYDFKVVGPYSVILHTNMPAPFKVVDGKLVTTEELSLEDGDRNIEITATNTKNKASVTRSFTIKVTKTSGISQMEAAPEVVSEQDYSLSGIRTNADAKGVRIVRQRLADGSVKALKRIVK